MKTISAICLFFFVVFTNEYCHAKVYTSTSEYLHDNDSIGHNKFIQDSLNSVWDSVNIKMCPKVANKLIKLSKMDSLSDSLLDVGKKYMQYIDRRFCFTDNGYSFAKDYSEHYMEYYFGLVCLKTISDNGIKTYLRYLVQKGNWGDEDYGKSILPEMLEHRTDLFVSCVTNLPDSSRLNVMKYLCFRSESEDCSILLPNSNFLKQLKKKYPLFVKDIEIPNKDK